MLNSRGSPWSVRWFPVSDAKLLASSENTGNSQLYYRNTIFTSSVSVTINSL